MTTKILQTEKTSNFKVGDHWVSRKRNIYKIIDVDTNPRSYYPILIENVESKILSTANSAGEIFRYVESLSDQLLMKVPLTFKPKNQDR